MFSLREAVCSDVIEIAKINLTCWSESFSKIVGEDVLSKISIDKGIKIWDQYFKEKRRVLLAFNPEDGLSGFISYGNAGLMQFEDHAEIFVLNVLKKYQNLGLGKGLFSRAAMSIYDEGYSQFISWVLKDNDAAINFYKKLGGNSVMFGKREICGRFFDQICFKWSR